MHYIYYHCVKKKNPNCVEKCITENELDKQIAKYYRENLEITKALSEWCVEHLEELEQQEKQNKRSVKETWTKELIKKQKEYEELIKMKMKGLLDEDEFLKLKDSVRAEIKQIERVISDTNNENSRLEDVKRAFDLSIGISEIFLNGGPEEKIAALSEICSNLTLKDKKVNVSNTKIYSRIINGLLEAKAKNPMFEPKKCEANKDKTDAFASVRPALLLG